VLFLFLLVFSVPDKFVVLRALFEQLSALTIQPFDLTF
jgi:hypothetical protein